MREKANGVVNILIPDMWAHCELHDFVHHVAVCSGAERLQDRDLLVLSIGLMVEVQKGLKLFLRGQGRGQPNKRRSREREGGGRLSSAT